MIIQRNKKRLVLEIPASVDIREIQDVLNFIRYKELTSSFKTRQPVVDAIANKVNKNWWKKNAKKFLNEGSR